MHKDSIYQNILAERLNAFTEPHDKTKKKYADFQPSITLVMDKMGQQILAKKSKVR